MPSVNFMANSLRAGKKMKGAKVFCGEHPLRR